MSLDKKHWDRIYEADMNKKPTYDLWLDKYDEILTSSVTVPIIDLGCGAGNDTLYLTERGYQVVSCDFSEKALIRLKYYINDFYPLCFDMKDGLPFDDNNSKVIISDLSLHYFTWEDTVRIVQDIKRVLRKDGVLLCRVNSVKDFNYGAGQGVKIEENFYLVADKQKRFFDEVTLIELFKEWKIQYIEETEMNRYEMKKIVWEICVRK